MKTVQLFKMLSCEIRSNLLVHLYTCTCRKITVSCLVDKFKTSQANISKHLKLLRENGCIDFKKNEQEILYFMVPTFREEWKKFFEYILEKGEHEQARCMCVCN